MIQYPLDANEIFPLLFQGSIPPQGDVLRRMGFAVVVLCAEESQPAAWKFEGIDVIYAPNDDDSGRPPTREELDIAIRTAKTVAMCVRDGKKVLVTCMAGLNRSGLVCALTMHILTGWPGSRCVQQVQDNRDAALRNPQFVTVLSKIPGKS